MSSAAWVGVAQVVMTGLIGGGGLYGIARGLALLWKVWNESKKLDNDGAAAVRKEMMDINDRLTNRIGTLETDLRDERKRCDDETTAIRKAHVEEMAALRKLHAEELREMHNRIEALHRQMIQMQNSTTAALRSGVNAPAASSKLNGDTERIGEVLRQTYNMPGVGEDK